MKERREITIKKLESGKYGYWDNKDKEFFKYFSEEGFLEIEIDTKEEAIADAYEMWKDEFWEMSKIENDSFTVNIDDSETIMVRCVEESSEYPHLTLGKEYEAEIDEEDGDGYYLFDDNNKCDLYPMRLFDEV